MKISSFTTITNGILNQFPFLDSIKSFLNFSDEVIIVDGGSNDETITKINEINSSKIKIILNEDTKWEDEWYYSRMGKNFDIGLQNCTGDVVIKFDSDYIFNVSNKDEKKGALQFRNDCESILKEQKKTIAFNRKNFILSDRYFVKSKKTFGINKILLDKEKVQVRYGLDLDRWGFGFDFIQPEFFENGIWFGNMIRTGQNSKITCADVFNYDNIFCDLDTVLRMRKKHMIAESLQQEMKYKNATIGIPTYSSKRLKKDFKNEIVWQHYFNMCRVNFNKKVQNKIQIDNHPKIIRDKIKNLNSNKQGYNFWGYLDTSSYYEKT